MSITTEREMPQDKWLIETINKEVILELVRLCLTKQTTFKVDITEKSPFEPDSYDFFVADTMEKYQVIFDALEDILEN